MSHVIAAIAAGGHTAIGVIRLSGDGTDAIVDRVFRAYNSLEFSSQEPRKMVYGDLLDREGKVIDHVLAVRFPAPHSYTGENSAELHCHGSKAVMSECLLALYKAGAQPALAGEYTKRAFLNGKLDLTQTEAVIDLISAETLQASRIAASQLGGSISAKLTAVYDELTKVVSHFQAAVDYPEEDIDPFVHEEARSVISLSHHKLTRLLETFERGRVIRDGVLTAIVGRPNAGKSSLLNALLGYERAIVTDIPGTTRDTIEEKAVLGGVLLRLTDTAGIRTSCDPVEQMGVDRALGITERAELILAVFDGSQPLTDEDRRVIEAVKAAPFVIAVINKSDLPQCINIDVLEQTFSRMCMVSALDGEGLEMLGSFIAQELSDGSDDDEILTNTRQAEAISRASDALLASLDGFDCVTPDAALSDVEYALSALGEVLGRSVRDDVINDIFGRFCVGK